MTAFDEDSTQVGAEDWSSDLETLNNNGLDDTMAQLVTNDPETKGADYTMSDILKKVTKVNTSNNKGSFIDAPFQSKNASWNINVKKKIFECGDKLKGPEGNKHDVLYQVWFRGRTITKD